MLTVKPVPSRGVVRVSGIVPNGGLTVQRLVTKSLPFTLRSGIKTITDNGFSVEDSEAPIGIPIVYTATSTPDARLIQRNLLRTPDFSHGVQTWTAGSSRTLSSTGTVSSSSTGTVRIIAEVATDPLVAGQTYLVTGNLRFRTPGVWTWQDVKNFGTWAAVKAAKPTWEAVRSSTPGSSSDSYATLYISLSNGSTDYLTPVQVYSSSMASTNQWFTFAAFITAPAGIPASARLRLLHGTSTREYSISWDLDKFAVMTATDAAKKIRLFWFSGDTPVPDRPQDYLTQESDWEDLSNDASITWEGTPGNSASRFTGPSVVQERILTQVNPPAEVPCEPVLLSDPVSTALSQWFGLSKIGPLTREARVTVMSVLGRSDFVSTSSARSSSKGTLTLYTETLEERANTIRLFQSGRVLLLRNPNPDYPENLWYLSLGDVQESRTIEPNARKSARTWTVPFVQVERPTGLIEASSGVTWQQIKDSGMTWRELRDSRPSWLDVALVEP